MNDMVESRPEYMPLIMLGVVLTTMTVLIIIQFRLDDSRSRRTAECERALAEQRVELDRALASQQPFNLVDLTEKPAVCL